MFLPEPQAHVDHFSQAFALQYISLILFILIFTIGAYMPKEPATVVIEPSRGYPKAVGSEVTLPEEPIAEIAFINAFDLSGSVLQRGNLEGLLFLLRNHDVRVDISIPFGGSVPSTVGIQRMRELMDFVVSAGVPAHAVKVVSLPSSATEQARVRVFHESH